MRPGRIATARHQRMSHRGMSWKRFLRDTRAAATALMAVFVVIMTVGGGALIVDHVWLVDQRDTLKAASNAAVIAATLKMKEVLAADPDIATADLEAALKPVAEGFVLANLTHLSEDRLSRARATLVVEVLPDESRSTVEVTVQADLGGFLFGTTLPLLSGVDQIESMTTEARVESILAPTEVVLAIDISKSMGKTLEGEDVYGNATSRLDIVKQAAKDLVAVLDPTSDNRVAIGLLPWHFLVRLDDTAMSKWDLENWAEYPGSRRYAFAYACTTEGCTSLDETQDLPDDPGEDWLGCLGEHRVSLDNTADLPEVEDLFDHPSDSAFAQSIFPAQYGRAYECLQPPAPDDLGYQDCYGTEDTDVLLVVSEVAPQPHCADVEGTDVDEGDAAPIFPLTSDRTAIDAAIDSLEPLGGGTYSALAVAWGQRLLSHAWNDVWGGGAHPVNPAADGNAGTRKAIVLLTDGEDNRCGWGDYTCSSRELGFERSVACTAAKKAGTKIFVVAAMHPDEVSTSLGTGLEACSSKADDPAGTYVFLNNADAASLRAAFADIAKQLLTVRRVH